MPSPRPSAPPVPVAAEPVDEVERRAEEIARNKNAQAWRGLYTFSQPVAVITLVGTACAQIHEMYGEQWKETVYEPCLTVPLAFLAIASVVSFAETDFRKLQSDYAFFFAKGLLTSLALLLSIPLALFFEKLNAQWFQGVFTGNVLHPVMGSGLRTLAVWRSLDLLLNAHLVRAIYG
jgi:hypothetical protein